MSNIDYKCHNHKILTREEEFDLFEEYSNTKSDRIRDKIIVHNMKFALKCANAYIARHAHVEVVDLKAYAVEGLMQAIDKFDHKRGKKFITFAVWWIKCNISRSVEINEGLIRYPANIHRELYQNYKNNSPLDSVDVETIEEADYRTIYSNIHGGISIDTPIEEDGEICIADTLYYEQDEDISEPKNLLIQSIKKALHTLPEKERYIIEETFGMLSGNKRTARDIAEELNMSHENVRYIRNKGIKLLKKMIKKVG